MFLQNTSPWNIVDTLPIYDQSGVIPGQTDFALSTPRKYFFNHPGWAASTLFDHQGNRAGTFLGELYHVYYTWNPDMRSGTPAFISRPRGERSQQLILFDESLHNYFHKDHAELADVFGLSWNKDQAALLALEAWAKKGCK